MSFSVRDLHFTGAGGKTSLFGRIMLPAERSARRHPAVIMLSGDGPKGTRSLSWVNLPPLLAERGIASFVFDFEGLGRSEGERRNLTVDKAVVNFRAAFSVFARQDGVDSGRIGVFGSSFGGTVALLCPDIVNRARALGLKSPALHLADAYVNECGDEDLGTWIEEGYSASLDYDLSVLRSALLNNAYAGAAEISVPTLITHGSADSTVPVRQSRLLQTVMRREVAQLRVLDGVGHSYAEEGAWDRMAESFVSWFAQNL
ncbi:alpha/beta hydrolase [Streptomyces carminius]|uniref:Alpha/beta hydrolase n=1 Tax=Streptomyces carminius TaxID=2665496 RepID=A0A2M8LWW5_9ACTN|nr:alpha/beta fold hydrolase [Streptomyces carminius]PJE96442.1 alpha/beta hydrolase [Streptomyces carminius]